MRRVTLQVALILLPLAVVSAFGPRASIAKQRVQTARVEINKRGYRPPSLRLRRGVPAEVTFVRTTDATCAKEIVLPDFGIRRALPLNEPVVISFTPNEKGTFIFVCGMNMMRGQLIVQ